MHDVKGWLGFGPRSVGVRRVFLALALLLALLAGCGEPATELAPTAKASATSTPAEATSTDVPASAPTGQLQDGYFHIGPEQLSAMLRDKDFFLVNTHAPYGYEIEGTNASIPLDRGGQWLSDYPADKQTKIVLYCRSGQWSTVAARELVRAGYENIWHLDGGLVAWDRAGLPLVRR